MKTLIQIAAATVVLLLAPASVTRAACQEEPSEVECSCLYTPEDQLLKTSRLVFLGHLEDDRSDEAYERQYRVIIVERFEKGRAPGRRVKVLDPPSYGGGGGCNCGPGMPYDQTRFRFYLSPSADRPGYYVLNATRMPR